MRTCIGGSGQDNTAALAAYLAARNSVVTRFLYLIGDPDNPQAIWATDHEAPVLYQAWGGTFQPAAIRKTPLTWKVGLDAPTTTLTWAPKNQVLTAALATASPLQLARIHFYDNWPVRIWKCYMPTPGDANSLGAVEWFMGLVGDCRIGRGQLQFSVAGLTSILSQKIPAAVVEVTNTLAGYAGATAPPASSIPVFAAEAGSTETVLNATTQTPSLGHIYNADTFDNGYAIFLAGAGATLAGAWSAIGQSLPFNDGHGNNFNQFKLYSPLPWPPTVGVDTFYVSAAAPIDQTEQEYYGFPWVPAPNAAV